MSSQSQTVINFTKKCNECLEMKPLAGFWKDTATRSGYNSKCKQCRQKYMSNRYHTNSEYRAKAIRSATVRNRKAKYGVDEKMFNALLIAQDVKCAICRTDLSNRQQHLDHCHATGAVRGILCNSCNTSLGGFKDNTEFLLSAINYLDKFRRN